MSTRTSKRGFTLLEIVVSVGIFALVMMVAMSTYVTLIRVDKRARATNQVVNNLSFAVDAMVRGIRTGTNYQCASTGGDSTNGTCSCFNYTDTNLNTTVTYHLMANGTIGRAVGTNSCLDSVASPITDPAISIANPGGLVFYVRGTGTGNDNQAQVLFTVKGTMPADTLGNTANFVIEQSATQRLIDL